MTDENLSMSVNYDLSFLTTNDRKISEIQAGGWKYGWNLKN